MKDIIYYGLYSKKCNNPQVLSQLHNRQYCWPEGKEHTYDEFIKMCKKYGELDKTNSCYIFNESPKLFQFIAKDCVPIEISDYVAINYEVSFPMLIIWVGSYISD